MQCPSYSSNLSSSSFLTLHAVTKFQEELVLCSIGVECKRKEVKGGPFRNLKSVSQSHKDLQGNKRLQNLDILLNIQEGPVHNGNKLKPVPNSNREKDSSKKNEANDKVFE